MPTTTIRVSTQTRDKLHLLADATGVSMQKILDDALESYRRQQILDEANDAYAALRNDPEAWEELVRERQQWEATLLDGLDKVGKDKLNEVTYFEQLDLQVSKVFERLPGDRDHRRGYRWLTGYLGDPFSGIWFLAENPSLMRVERIAQRSDYRPSPDLQWSESPGDKLFRDMLVKHGFKLGEAMAEGGWRCYITDIIKETDYVQRWRDKSQVVRNRVAEEWAPVLIWELAYSRPQLIVVMGRQTQRLISHLAATLPEIKLPPTTYLDHYAYIGSRPQGSLGPMHPTRIRKYDTDFQRIAELFRRQSNSRDGLRVG